MLKRYRFPLIFLIFLVFCVNCAVTDLFADEQSNSFKIAIFKEKGFPYIGTPEDLSADWIGGNLEEYDVICLNTDKLRDKGLFNADGLDLLILPYGEAVPEDGLPAIVEFVRNGGGLFTIAGRPFGCVLKKKDESWEKLDSLIAHKYISSLGLIFYEIHSMDIASAKNMGDMFHMELEMKLPSYDQYGICVKTSERIYNKPPTKGNVFPHRIPARNFMNPIILLDRDDNYIGAPLTLVKSWSNPYIVTGRVPNKWCLIGFVGENHPLNPKDKNSAKRLNQIIRFLSTKIILTGIKTDYASYRNGETIRISAEVLNYGVGNKDAVISFFVISDNKILVKQERRISIGNQEMREVDIIWRPETLDGDFYKVKAVLKVDGEAIDEEKNAFTVWHKNKLENKQWLTIKGKYFYQNNNPFFLYGTNYYESRTGGLMWVSPNILDIERDLRLMSNFGINFLRVHYHHPDWFRDYFEATGLPISSYFENTEDIERSLRIMDAFIVLCNKHNIYFQPDIFTLVPKEMGDPKGWIGDVERCRNREKIEKQKDFVRILADRYKDIPNITWDLWNEPFLKKEELPILQKWILDIKGYFRSQGDRHLITLGSDESIITEDGLDFLCGHGYDVEMPETAKPFIIQEVWNESDLSPEREAAQAEKLKRDFVACFKQGGAGFVPWQWTRQSRLWDDASDAERWDNELGLCIREDGSLKPAGKMYMNLIRDAE